MTNAVLTQNSAKRSLHKNRRFCSRFMATVMTMVVLTQNDFLLLFKFQQLNYNLFTA